MSCEEEASCSHAKKKARLEPICEIHKLADEDLSEIFKRLPPYERLITSEVCKRWQSVSSSDWTDVTHLDLSLVPGPNIAAVIERCPNLRHISASQKTFQQNELHFLSRLELRSVNLYGCTFIVEKTGRQREIDVLAAIFSDAFPAAALEELVLFTPFVKALYLPAAGAQSEKIKLPADFPVSVKRLMISDVMFLGLGLVGSQRDAGIEQLRHVDCLVLHSNVRCSGMSMTYFTGARLARVRSMTNLKELYLSERHSVNGWEKALMQLGILETLFLHNFGGKPGSFDLLAAKHPCLRILVLAGSFDQLEFPNRLRYGCGFGAEPLPQLHIFVGRIASKKIRFPKYPSDIATVHPISAPLPEFLDQADIKPIFQGVWIAEKIRETAKHGSKLYKYEQDVAEGFISIEN